MDSFLLQVSFSRAQTLGTLEINKERVGYGRSIGRTRSINVRTPYFVGGIPMDLKKKAANNLKVGNLEDGVQSVVDYHASFVSPKLPFIKMSYCAFTFGY